MDQPGTPKQLVQAHVGARIWHVEYTNGEQDMSVEIKISCPECGEFTMHVAAHHVLSVLAILTDAAEKHSDLVKVNRTRLTEETFKGNIPEDPSRN